MTKPEPNIITIDWQGITLSVTHKPAYFCAGTEYEVDHLEIRSVSPEDACLPITETGYRSHFIPHEHIDAFGGAEGYVRAWLDEESTSTKWRTYLAASKQLSLF